VKVIQKISLLLILIVLSIATQGKSINHNYINADDIKINNNDVQVHFNNDGSFKSFSSTANVEFLYTDEKSVKKALIVAGILAKVNLSRYINQEISSVKSLHDISNQAGDFKTYIINIKKSSNNLMKGITAVSRTIDKENKHASVTIKVSHKNMQFVNKAKHILGMIRTVPSKDFEAHIKSLKINDGVSVIRFNDKEYIVSLATKKNVNSKLSSRSKAYHSTNQIARTNLSKFIHGEKINYNSHTMIKNITAIKYNQSEMINKIIESFIEENSGTYSGGMKAIGFNSLKYINNRKMFYYLYLEVPEN